MNNQIIWGNENITPNRDEHQEDCSCIWCDNKREDGQNE